MTLNNTLESLSLGNPDNIDEVTLYKNILGADLRTHLHLAVKLRAKIPELEDSPLGGGACLLEMSYFSFVGMLLLLVPIRQLNGTVAISLGILYLRHHAEASLNNCTGNVLPIRTEHTGQSYLFSYNSRHV